MHGPVGEGSDDLCASAVLSCYRCLLGRAPENADVVVERLRQEPETLIKGFLESKEFEARVRREVLDGHPGIQRTVHTPSDVEFILSNLHFDPPTKEELGREFCLSKLLECLGHHTEMLAATPKLLSLVLEHRLLQKGTSPSGLAEAMLLKQENARFIEAIFDLQYYSGQVMGVFDNSRSALVDYLSRPRMKRSDPSPYFSRKLYALANPSIIAWGIDPITHYINVGRFTWANPHPLFDTHLVAKQVGKKHSFDEVFFDFVQGQVGLDSLVFHHLVDFDYIRSQTGSTFSPLALFKVIANSDIELNFNPSMLFDVTDYNGQSPKRLFRNQLIDYILKRSSDLKSHPLLTNTYYIADPGVDVGRLTPSLPDPANSDLCRLVQTPSSTTGITIEDDAAPQGYT